MPRRFSSHNPNRQVVWLGQQSNKVKMSPYFAAILAAIFLAEGGENTRYPYGVKSVHTSSKQQAREIAARTIENNYVRWWQSGCTNSFVDFLGDRYCPSSVDPIGNINWKRNVKYFLRKNPPQYERDFKL